MKNRDVMMGAVAMATLLGCGGSHPPARQPPAAAATPAAEVATPEPAPTAPLELPAPAPVVEAAPPPPPPAPPPVVATVEVMGAKDGAAMGSATFSLGDDGVVTIAGAFTGLSPGKHALYIHTKGDCSGRGAKVGGHLDPTGAKHGPPASATRHAGDFGDLDADAAGNATFAMTTDSVSLMPDRPDSILARALVIHARADDRKGSGGPAVACGVIALRE
ncbi:MAG: superoxide dismutase family protein [Myxococcales bacterium]|nr:superoxide dismutase family protein [Myxococcales bacterium]